MWRLEFVRWEWMWDSTNNCSLQFPLSLQKPSQNLLSVAISKESPSSAVPTSVHLYHCPALTALLKLCMETVTSHASKCNSIFLLLVLKQIKLMIFHLHHFAIFFFSLWYCPSPRPSFIFGNYFDLVLQNPGNSGQTWRFSRGWETRKTFVYQILPHGHQETADSFHLSLSHLRGRCCSSKLGARACIARPSSKETIATAFG